MEVAYGPTLGLLERVRKDIRDGKSMMNDKEQFYYFRMVATRFQTRFVDALPETGKIKAKPHDAVKWLKPDAKPVRSRPYTLTPLKVEAMQRKMDKLEATGIVYKVKESDSKWCSPAYPVWDKSTVNLN